MWMFLTPALLVALVSLELFLYNDTYTGTELRNSNRSILYGVFGLPTQFYVHIAGCLCV